jgi:hypothetical protein
VVSVEMKCSDSVVVRLESDELGKAAKVVSTGLDCEQSRKIKEAGLEVTCNGDPRAEIGEGTGYRQLRLRCRSQLPCDGCHRVHEFGRHNRDRAAARPDIPVRRPPGFMIDPGTG